MSAYLGNRRQEMGSSTMENFRKEAEQQKKVNQLYGMMNNFRIE